MATDVARPDRAPMTIAELVSFTKKELDSDAERARLQASSAGVLPAESQAGTTLDLSNAKIHALPVEVLVLIKDRVERLALSHNHQISIPSQIVQCERLRYLNIRWNELTQFPRAILQLSNLEILDLSKNSITSIPEDVNRLSSLRFLAISNNKVTRLPLSIGDMTNLGRLKVDENPITFPPPEVFRPSKDKMTSRAELQRSSDVCQNVKRFLKETANKEKQKLASEDELSESNAETPRPPRRTATGGRFPIRPSVSGIENVPSPRVDSPAENVAPPIPQRSHARINSSASGTTNATLRPSIAPLATDKNDISRSRSETTTSSSASLRQRRQGFVPSRKATGDLTLVPESDQASVRTSQASTIKPTHNRGTSSISTVNSYLGSSSGGGSSGLTSPIEGPKARFPGDELSKSQSSTKGPDAGNAVKSMKRLYFTLRQLQRPMREVAHALKLGSPERLRLDDKLQGAQSVNRELEVLYQHLQNRTERGTTTDSEAMQAMARVAVRSLRSFGDVTTELQRKTPLLVKTSDGFVVRGLMTQLHLAVVEIRNMCSILGFKVRHKPSAKEPPRISQAWSSKSITPTQPKAPMNSRLRNGTPLSSMNSPPSLRGAPQPPAVPLNTNISRMNTMTSMSAATPRSGDTFQIHEQRDAHRRPNLSRNNTMRSMFDVGENDEQFDRIFLKLKQACDLAAQALPHLRSEFNNRRELAQNAGQRSLLQQWPTALKKCELVITNNKNLKKRLELVKVNDPGVRYQRDFWQLCDAFVHSWTDLATVVKEIGGQRIDITVSKQIMRSVQKAVKDASKMISNSPLYHHAIGPNGTTANGHGSTNGLAPPFNANASIQYPSSAGSTSSAQGNYVVGGPATPLEAAIGPAARSIQPQPLSGDYVSAGRGAHERVDTVMQQPPRQQSRRQQQQ